MEKKEAVREWCLEKALQLIALRGPIQRTDVKATDAIQVACKIEKYVCEGRVTTDE